MELKEHPPVSNWQTDGFLYHRDIIIVGAGNAGLWTAAHLLEKYPGKSLLALEKGHFPSGASVANGGFRCFGSPTEMLIDESQQGQKMWELYDKRIRGMEMIHKLSKSYPIGFEDCGGYECYTGTHDLKTLPDKIRRLNEKLYAMTGNRQVFSWCGPEKIDEFGLTGFTAMVRNNMEGAINSGKMVNALIDRVHALGGRVQGNMHVVKYNEEKMFVHLLTEDGYQFACKYLFICTNGLAKELVPDAPIEPARGQMIITSPIPNLKLHGTFHLHAGGEHLHEGFYYFRHLHDQRVLIGGGRYRDLVGEHTTEVKTSPVIQDDLKRLAREHVLYGHDFDVEQTSAAIMSYGTEPTTWHRPKGSDRVVFFASDNGIGVSTIPVASKERVDKVELDL